MNFYIKIYNFIVFWGKNMQTNIWKKVVVLGLLIIFIGVSVIPGITANLIISNYNLNADLIENKGKWEKTLEYPPYEEWNYTFGGTDADISSSVQQTTDGGYILAGWTLSFGAGSNDVWLIKTDSNGTEEWNQTFGGTSDDYGYSVQQTTDGGYIITGDIHSFGPGGADAWLIKTNSTGNEVWNRTFGGTNGDIGRCVQKTSDGGYIITGYTSSFGTGSIDAWLIKTDSNGTEEWNQTFGGTEQDWGSYVQQTVDGGYIITGRTSSYGDLHFDVWLIKTDSNGSKEWDEIFDGGDYDFGNSVQQTTDGGYIITGWTYSNGAGSYDVWLIKTDSNGTEEWNKTFGGANSDEGNSVQQTTDGGYIIAGETYSFGAGSNDVWLIKTDSNGSEEWNQTFGGVNSEYGFSVQQTFDGGYIIEGITYSYGAGSSDFWLISIVIVNNSPPYEPANPYPENNSEDVDVNTNLGWTGGDPDGDDVTYDVYFEANDSTPDILVSNNQSLSWYNPGTLEYNTHYYWQIIAWDEYGLYTDGSIWNFTTGSEPNNPPNFPNNPSPVDGATEVDIDADLSWDCDDPDGDFLTYNVYFDTINPPLDNVSDDQVDTTFDLEILEFGTTYYWQIIATDEHNASTAGMVWQFTTSNNNPPNAPTINGPNKGEPEISYEYSFSSIDPDGHDIAEYTVDWGDNTGEETISGPFASGKEVTANHSWDSKDTYIIKAKAKDINGAESDWSELKVTIPRSKTIYYSLFYRFLELFPMLERLLEFIRTI